MSDNCHVESPFVNIYTPYPGTPLYSMAKKEGFIPPKTLDGWSQIVWNCPNITLYRNEEFCNFLYKVSNEFLRKSRYLR